MADSIYLDNAATTFPQPDVVHDAVHDFYRNYGVNPGRRQHLGSGVRNGRPTILRPGNEKF